MNYQYRYLLDRLAGRDPSIRAADADRERTGERLRQAHAEGRLDVNEFQQRLERCYEAKTFGELDELVRDLPRQEQQIERPPHASSLLRPLLSVPVAPILIALLLVTAAGAHHIFWMWIPLLFVVWRISARRRRRWVAGPRRGPNGWI